MFRFLVKIAVFLKLILVFIFCIPREIYGYYISDYQIATVSMGYRDLWVFATGTDSQIHYVHLNGTVWSQWGIVYYMSAYSGPSVCSSLMGRLDLFAIHYQYGLTWNWINDTQNGMTWQTYWPNLGGVLLSGVICATNSNTSLVAFGVSSDYHIWLFLQLDGTWTDISSPNCLFANNTPGAVYVNENLYVFGRGQDNFLYYKIYDSSNPSSIWIQQPNIVLNSGPAVVSWDATRIDVFYMGANYNLWHSICMLGSPWVITSEDLGLQIYSTPSVSSYVYGRFDVFVKGPGNKLWTISYDQCENRWQKWKNLWNFSIF